MKEKSEVAELQLFVLLGRRGGPRKGGGAPPALVLGISVGESPPPPTPLHRLPSRTSHSCHGAFHGIAKWSHFWVLRIKQGMLLLLPSRQTLLHHPPPSPSPESNSRYLAAAYLLSGAPGTRGQAGRGSWEAMLGRRPDQVARAPHAP